MKQPGPIKLFLFSQILPLAFIIAFPTAVYFGFRHLRENMQILEDEHMFLAFNAQTLRYDTIQIQQFLSDISATRGQDGLNDGFDKAKEARADFDEKLAQLEAYYRKNSDAKGLEHVASLRASMTVFHDTGIKMAQLYIDQGPGGGNGFMPQFDEAAARMSTSLEEFTVAKRQSLEEKIASLKHLLDVISNSFAIVSALLLLAILGTIFYGFRRAKQIAGHIVQSIAEESRQINQSSESLLSASQSLASANEEQAAAVQENAASMAEISTTIRTTAQNSQAAQEKSSKVSEDAEHGRTIVNDLVQAMAVVKKANDELGAIVETVGKISEKTAVINDIVFKTQLLSFNASIEAARAGQHGRGFAVVAEEVGNLAQLSGKAANEIRSIISDSQQQIQGFVHSSRSSIDHVASITNNVQSIFHDIAKDVDTILKQMSDVSHSNTEQQRGMDELTLASRQIDEGTSLNARMAWDVDNQAKLLKQQSEALEKLCDTISRMLVGQSLATGNQSQLPLQPTSGQQDEQSEAPLRLVS